MPPPASPAVDFERTARPLPAPGQRAPLSVPVVRRRSLQREARDIDFLRRLRESGL